MNRLILINKLGIIYFLLILSVGCMPSNNQKKSEQHRKKGNDDYKKVLDFSTSSSFIITKLSNGIDTMTVVLPSEVLGRYLRETFVSDSSYANAILNTISNGVYLTISSIVYDALQSYSVTFNDSFISSWNSKSSQQIANAFFKLNAQKKYYSCFENEENKNQVLYLLIRKKSEVHTDDETGCIVIEAVQQ